MAIGTKGGSTIAPSVRSRPLNIGGGTGIYDYKKKGGSLTGDIIDDPNPGGLAEFMGIGPYDQGYMAEDWMASPSELLMREGLSMHSNPPGLNPIVGQNLLKALGGPLCRPGDPFCK